MYIEKLQTKKTLKLHLDLNFNNFQRKKIGEVLG